MSLLFVWLELERQVIINGRADKISAADSARYFMSRPKDSQIAAWVSSQSHGLSSHRGADAEIHRDETEIQEGKIPLPSFWGGYRVVAPELEFWQGRENRLHDRFMYTRNGPASGWDMSAWPRNAGPRLTLDDCQRLQDVHYVNEIFRRSITVSISL